MTAELPSDTHEGLIVAIARCGDREAFARLFQHFAPRVKSYLQRSGMEFSAAEELAQDVLLSVWRKAGQYDPQCATASAWIFGIARNLRIDAFRRLQLAMQDVTRAEDVKPVPLADALLAIEQTSQRMREAIGALPADQVEMLQLAFFEDRSHSEIVALLGIPLGTIKSRLRLAISKLRSALKDQA